MSKVSNSYGRRPRRLRHRVVLVAASLAAASAGLGAAGASAASAQSARTTATVVQHRARPATTVSRDRREPPGGARHEVRYSKDPVSNDALAPTSTRAVVRDL